MLLEFTRVADADLARIFDFNQSRGLSWAARVEERLLKRAASLLTTPRIGRPTPDPGVFRLSVPDIQYVIDYRIMSGRIRVLRILSTREIG